MKRIYLVLIATIAITFVSCSDQEIDTVKPDAGQVAPIIDLPEGATQGRILVKFKPEAASFLDAATTRSVGAALTRSGISDMDAVLQRIGTSKLERISHQAGNDPCGAYNSCCEYRCERSFF